MKTIIVFLAFMTLVSSLPAQAPDFKVLTPQLDRFVRDITLVGRDKRTVRWLSLPRLEVVSSSPALKTFVEQSFASITQATGLVTPGEGVFYVFTGTSREFASLEIAQRRQLKMVGGTGCMYWTNTDRSLREVLVYVKDSPKDTEELRQHHLFHNILAGFGFMNNSPLFPDSTFGSNNAFDLRLSPLDIQMISFCYRHVPPASLSSDVSKHLKLNWGK
jgi:hypothetical protein